MKNMQRVLEFLRARASIVAGTTETTETTETTSCSSCCLLKY